ncbi:unnamed protein product [Parajaminaea phylloscopi]
MDPPCAPVWSDDGATPARRTSDPVDPATACVASPAVAHHTVLNARRYGPETSSSRYTAGQEVFRPNCDIRAGDQEGTSCSDDVVNIASTDEASSIHPQLFRSRGPHCSTAITNLCFSPGDCVAEDKSQEDTQADV